MRAYDTVVIGGGPSGVPATVQTARLGARTLLVEKNAGLGGTTTSANVAFPGLFHAWGEQVIGGIGWELVCRTVELSGEELPDLRDDEHPSGPAVPRRGPGTAGARHSRRRPVARSGLERPFVATFLYRLGRFSFRRQPARRPALGGGPGRLRVCRGQGDGRPQGRSAPGTRQGIRPGNPSRAGRTQTGMVGRSHRRTGEAVNHSEVDHGISAS